MHPDDRNFVSWLFWSVVVTAIATMFILGMLEKGEGQQQPPQMPPPPVAPPQVQLRHFPLEGTNFDCVAAVTTRDAAPAAWGLSRRPLQEDFDWIGCFDRKRLGITPTPTPEPTKAKVS